MRIRLFVPTILVALAAALLFGGSASSSSDRTLATINLRTLNIANALPLDLGVQKGFFSQRGIEINKKVLQSGNDVVLSLANGDGDIGYLGYVPAMIGRVQGIKFQMISASEVEGTSVDDNWQNIMVKGNSSIRTPQDLAGKTIAVNALKGVGEVMIKAALKKVGVDPNSPKLLAIGFGAMRSALNNGQIDAFWAPEPFVSQGLNLDGDRIVMAPGPVLGKFWPIGGYGALDSWVAKNPQLAKSFHEAINESLAYAQAHPDEIRALLPAGTQNVRLPIWSPVVDRSKLVQLAKYAKEFGVIDSLPNMTRLVPSTVTGGKVLQGTVGNVFITLRLDGKAVTTLPHGKYTIVVTDNSKTTGFKLAGPGVTKQTSVKGTGRSTWTLTLKKGKYVYSSITHPKRKRTLKIS
ncbi:MAG TPA: ABC transporter substrate-binding protein [Gaiellaceae bacterium]|nr:ABC transporter substrate-binding protein [Gaiellaceae bacterium]